MLYRTVDLAIPIFQLALTYRPVHTEQVEARKSLSEEILRSRAGAEDRFKLGLLGFAALTIVGGLILKWRQGR